MSSPVAGEFEHMFCDAEDKEKKDDRCAATDRI